MSQDATESNFARQNDNQGVKKWPKCMAFISFLYLCNQTTETFANSETVSDPIANGAAGSKYHMFN
jgi:hypothetical protein